jgi:hypothetical protein
LNVGHEATIQAQRQDRPRARAVEREAATAILQEAKRLLNATLADSDFLLSLTGPKAQDAAAKLLDLLSGGMGR